MANEPTPFPLFKGCTRVPTIAGVPMIPAIFMFIAVASVAMLVSMWCWLLVLPAWVVMAQITRHDDRAFRIVGLWFETKLRNRNQKFWGASSYARAQYRKKK